MDSPGHGNRDPLRITMKHPKFDVVLVDGDCALFRAGFAAERVIYHIVPRSDEDCHLATSQDKEALINLLDEEYDTEQHIVIGEKDIGPFEGTVFNLKAMLDLISDATDCNYRRIYLSDPSGASFRKALDPQYKANRDPFNKPFWYPELRYYLLGHYECVEATRGMEADDLLGIAQCKGKEQTVIASVDKDFKQIPGWHYNIMHRQLFHVDEQTADLWLWQQMLIGDTADNIKGVHGIGPVKAAKLLQDKSPEEARELVKDLYQKYKGQDWEDDFEVNRQLLTILRRAA